MENFLHVTYSGKVNFQLESDVTSQWGVGFTYHAHCAPKQGGSDMRCTKSIDHGSSVLLSM